MDTVYFYHSRPEVDVTDKNKRVTVACVISNNKMCFGKATQNVKMKDVFQKVKGRKIAMERATKKPILVIEAPTENVKQTFLLEACKIVKKELSKRKNEAQFDKALQTKMEKLKNSISNKRAQLKNLIRFMKSHQPEQQPDASTLNPQ